MIVFHSPHNSSAKHLIGIQISTHFDGSVLKNDSSQKMSSQGPAVVSGPLRPFHILLLAGVALGNRLMCKTVLE